DIVAIAIRIGTVRVVLVAVGFGKADHVEPVASPLLAVMRRSEQTLDQLLVGLRGLIVDEGVDFFGRRGQPEEVVGDSANEGRAIGLGGGLEALFAKARQYETVDRRTDPGVGDRRRGGFLPGLKCPIT